MFFNALSRKGKIDNKEEETHMESVVAIHNNMNEKTWAKVVEWESVSDPGGQDLGGTKLLKFIGRPSNLAPKARFKAWVLGHPLPFDRHDWTVMRPDGMKVRYVIDYYHDESSAREDADSAHPSMHDRNAVKSVLVDVRPALDSPQSMFDRVFIMPYARRVSGATMFETLPMIPTEELKKQVGESEKVWENIKKSVQDSSDEMGNGKNKRNNVVDGKREKNEENVAINKKEAIAIASMFATMLKECQEAQKTVDACEDEVECTKASLALTMCMGKIICPLQHSAVAKSLNAEFDDNDDRAVVQYNARVDQVLENLAACVVDQSERASAAKISHPKVFKQ